MKYSVKNRRLILLSLLTALLFGLICSKSSPLYPANDWVDANCFMTVGKAMRNGWVPYRDICEQKGPLLYFIYAAAAWISDTSFVGAFIFDTLAMAAFLYISAKTVQLLLGEHRIVYPAIVVLALLVHCCDAFAHGGSAEALCLWTLAYGIYACVRMFKEARSMTVSESFLMGVAAAFVLWIKFNLCVFFAGLALVVLIFHLAEKRLCELGKMIAGFFGGLAAVSMLVILYFAVHGAVADLFEGYFFNNLFYYGDVEKYRLMNIAGRMLRAAIGNPLFFVLIAWGMLWLLLRRKPMWRIFTAMAVSFGILIPCVYWSHYLYYYALIFVPAAIFGLTALCSCLLKLSSKLRKSLFQRGFAVFMALLMLLTVGCAYFYSGNTYLMKVDRNDMPAYRFARQINQVENATVLNYGFLDGGFYHAAGILPPTKYFCMLNAGIPGLASTQREMVETGAVDFVVCMNKKLESEKYVCVDSMKFRYEGMMCSYYLYQRV